MVFLVVHIDDILLTGNDEVEIASLKFFLDSTFKIKDLGYANYFLSIEILRSDKGLLLIQRKFNLELLEEFNSKVSSSVICPLDYNTKLTPHDGDLLVDPSTYRRLIRRLNFLTNSRLTLPSQSSTKVNFYRPQESHI